jgi:hypothetical protein
VVSLSHRDHARIERLDSTKPHRRDAVRRLTQAI